MQTKGRPRSSNVNDLRGREPDVISNEDFWRFLERMGLPQTPIVTPGLRRLAQQAGGDTLANYLDPGSPAVIRDRMSVDPVLRMHEFINKLIIEDSPQLEARRREFLQQKGHR